LVALACICPLVRCVHGRHIHAQGVIIFIARNGNRACKGPQMCVIAPDISTRFVHTTRPEVLDMMAIVMARSVCSHKMCHIPLSVAMLIEHGRTCGFSPDTSIPLIAFTESSLPVCFVLQLKLRQFMFAHLPQRRRLILRPSPRYSGQERLLVTFWISASILMVSAELQLVCRVWFDSFGPCQVATEGTLRLSPHAMTVEYGRAFQKSLYFCYA
jgi:hypothetical protein